MNCKFCLRSLVNAGTLSIHEKSCKSNPNRISRTRSKYAGAQKNCVPWNKGTKIGRNSYWDTQYPDDIVFVENSKVARHAVKSNILRRNLIEYRCACCKIGPEWNGMPMPLILDHINGINNDNRLTNLRFVCSNCDSQLPTYKSKNKGRSTVLANSTVLKTV